MGASRTSRALLLLGLAAVGSLVHALPADPNDYMLHETRGGMRHKHWKRGERVEGDALLPLRIGLTQSNLDRGYQVLADVSDPASPKYGQHLSAEEVIELFAPEPAAADAVRQWLIDEGIPESSILPYENKGWLGVDIPTQEAERLFQTEYFEHGHEHHGLTRLGCQSYHVPRHLSRHIDYITPGVKLSSPLRRSIERRGTPAWSRGNLPQKLPPTDDEAWVSPAGASDLPTDVQNCAVNFTVACYRALYDIPATNVPQPGNTLGIFESGDTYSQEDLNAYYAAYTPYIPQGTGPLPAFIDGAEAPVSADSPYNTGESDIDFSIAIPLIYPQTVTLYQTDDRPQSELESNETITGFLNTFLDALDGSYCSYTAYGITGDSPGIDAQYPDPLPGGYKGPLMCGAYKPARVISGSYGQSELDLPLKYTERQCNEFMKLGLQGHTILFSSSDYGVASFAGDITPSGCLSGCGQNQTIYNPDYPADCPFLTAVGATQLQRNQTVKDPESALQTPLGNGSLAFFASAGGFSNYFPAPDYQKKALETYFAKHDPGHPYYVANADATNIGANGGIYNRAGRGIPDVSANGANFRTFMNGTQYHFFGTSLAAPLWGAVITLINQERQAIGKGPVGFINPVLYANPGSLTDIKNGSNPNCGSSGFSAVEGWDPVTGLGTPHYPALLSLFLGLP